jgi:alanyl-tRNA synthetase
MIHSAQIRRQVLDFFVGKHGHRFVPSSPVVPLDDPTLLFTNAGMNQFKPIFLGQKAPQYPRVANSQKCIRAGGKHNDLDDVGRSRRHHTFFEMLGNWSFGDYFKRGAIEMAWELLTNVWKLDPARLHVSCYEGDEESAIPRDTEAADLWKQIAGLSDDHIHYFGKENFWEMGDTGPCGPCSEIFIDRTPDKTGGPQVNGDDPRVMEIWNLVFIQYNRDANGKLTPLPARHVDTGMGFERLCQVLQDKQDNYATDLWSPLLDRVSEISGLKYTGQFPRTNSPDPAAEAANEQLRHDIAFRVVADHARCLTFALTDGAVPSNEGRGYVLRRILRRAVRFGRQQLQMTEPFMHKLVPVIVDTMGGAFPELRQNPQHAAELIKDEEIGFGRTLDLGISLFDQAIYMMLRDAVFTKVLREHPGSEPLGLGGISGTTNPTIKLEVRGILSHEIFYSYDGGPISAEVLKEVGGPTLLPGPIAFRLHDTHGFPIDLTRIMAEERGMSVDIAGYEKLMEQARQIARGATKEQDSNLADLPPEALAQLREAAVATNDQPKFFHEPIEARVMAIWNGDDLGLSPANVYEDEQLAIILDRTNFYAEMGGQVGDSGALHIFTPSPGTPGEGGGEGSFPRDQSKTLTPTLSRSTGRGENAASIFEVETTRNVGGFVLHIGRLRSGTIRVGDRVKAIVSPARPRTEQNHTSTHLANWALREVLGEGVQQKGSLVDPEKLRFDFSHGKAMSDEEIGRVEELVSREIAKKLPVHAEEAPQEQALKINGLRAVFGEKYPAMVRVVSIGVPVKDLLADPANAKWRQFSIEFCGGTHLRSSDQASAFVITAEESVSKGIRRIVALTGQAARATNESAARADALLQNADSVADADLTPLIVSLNQAVSSPLPLRAKRRMQAAVAQLQTRYKTFEKTSKPQSSSDIDPVAIAGKLLSEATDLHGAKLIVGEMAGASDEQLRSAVDSLRKRAPAHAILLASSDGQKANFVAAVSDDLIARGLKAGDWVKQTAAVAGGGGGGRPNMAQGSGKDPAKIAEALQMARSLAAKY